MKTEKKCLGTGVAKGYGCKEIVPVSVYSQPNRKYGLGISCGCYPMWLYNSKEGQEKLSQATLKATKPRKELEEAKALKRQKNSLSYLLVNVRTSVHRYIRERDKHYSCISCDCDWNSDFQAGHFYKSELYSELRYDYDNIHGQCVRCNIFLDGNINDYSVRLPKRIGLTKYKKLVKRAEESKKNKTFKYNRETLIKIREKANILYNHIKKV